MKKKHLANVRKSMNNSINTQWFMNSLAHWMMRKKLDENIDLHKKEEWHNDEGGTHISIETKESFEIPIAEIMDEVEVLRNAAFSKDIKIL